MSDAPPSPKHDLTEGALLRITALQGTVFTALGLGIWVVTGRGVQDWLSFGLYDIKIGLRCENSAARARESHQRTSKTPFATSLPAKLGQRDAKPQK